MLTQASNQKHKLFDSIMEHYDADASGDLDENEIRSFMTKFKHGVAPTDAEVALVLRLGGNVEHKTICRKELPSAYSIMGAVVSEAGSVAVMYEKFLERSHGQMAVRAPLFLPPPLSAAAARSCCCHSPPPTPAPQLDEEHVNELLTDLNDGHPPTKLETEWIIHEADFAHTGVLDRDTLQCLVHIWYTSSHPKEEAAKSPGLFGWCGGGASTSPEADGSMKDMQSETIAEAVPIRPQW